MMDENYLNEGGKVRKELEELAPGLAAMKKANPFVVPENYFSQLEEKMLQRIKPAVQPATVPEPELSLWQQLVQWIEQSGGIFVTGRVLAPTLTACLVIAAGIYFMPQPGVDAHVQFASISQEEAEAYINDHSDEVDLTELSPEALNTVASLDEFRPSVDGISEEALQEYLTDNIDEETLTEEVL